MDLREARLRANPAYELVLFDRLGPAEQQTLEALGRDPDAYGILRPLAVRGLHAKSISREMALLWLTLQQPARLPRYAVRMLGDSCNQVIGQMILDGVLEIESDGRMLSGPAAQGLICADVDNPGPETAVAALSRHAIDYGASLEIADPLSLAGRLYAYNSAPASARWRRMLPDTSTVERYLGMHDGATGRLLRSAWVRLPGERRASAWIAWSSIPRQARENETIYKLYISAACSDLRAAFEATASVVDRCNAVQWKVGADVYGLLRPDKMVAYFVEMTDLQQAASLLTEKLAGCPGQGVPFTAEIAGGGLLSWGIDPLTDEYAVPWLQRESWRVRICNGLASALLLAKSIHQTKPSAGRFAIDRLRLEGIDTASWTPTRDLCWAAGAQGR